MKAFVVTVSGLLAACSMTSMPGKLDKTNSSVSNMDHKMDHMDGSMDSMDTKMSTTNSAIHNQILLLAIQEMTKPENTMVLTPPIGMMPAGQKFAEEATSDEVLALAHAWLTEYDYANLDKDDLKSSGYVDSDVNKMQADLQHLLEAKFVALQIIAGMLPEATVAKMSDHVLANGLYKTDALAMLTLRSYFIDTFLLQLDLFRLKLTQYGQMVKAMDLVKSIDDLGRLPFAASITLSTKKSGDVTFDAKSTLVRLYGELDSRFDSDLDQIYQHPNTPELQQQAADLAQRRQQVKDNLAYWQGR